MLKKSILSLLLACFLLFSFPSMSALLFGANTTDKVNHGSATILDDLNINTVMVWARPSALTANRTMISKANGASRRGWRFNMSGTGGDISAAYLGSTTNALNTTSDTPFVSGVWSFAVATFDLTTTPMIHIYTGRLDSVVAENSYSGTQDLVGTPGADTSLNLSVGNQNNAAGYNVAFTGDIAFAAVWNRVLTFGEIRQQQFFPRKTTGCVLFTYPGFTGTGTQPDWSGNGNSGAVTGATQSAHVPLGIPLF